MATFLFKRKGTDPKIHDMAQRNDSRISKDNVIAGHKGGEDDNLQNYVDDLKRTEKEWGRREEGQEEDSQKEKWIPEARSFLLDAKSSNGIQSFHLRSLREITPWGGSEGY